MLLFGDRAFGGTGFDDDTLARCTVPVVGVLGNGAAWNQLRYDHLKMSASASDGSVPLLEASV